METRLSRDFIFTIGYKHREKIRLMNYPPRYFIRSLGISIPRFSFLRLDSISIEEKRRKIRSINNNFEIKMFGNKIIEGFSFLHFYD